MGLRRGLVILSVIAGCCGGTVARADHAPAIVVPGRPDVPVIINGRDARGAIVIGDWGLYRPGAVAPTVIYRQPWPKVRFGNPVPRVRKYRRKRVITKGCNCVQPAQPKPVVKSGPLPFFPGGPRPPRQGRLERDVPLSPAPKPAESFSRSWSTSSEPVPATIGEPPAIVAPTVIENRFRPRRRLEPPRRPLPPVRPRR